jgi:diaminopimelate epimerase
VAGGKMSEGATLKFHKYQALGNDYLVVEGVAAEAMRPALVQRICDRHFGVGSDGILLETPVPDGEGFGLRIFNPDGSEAEKSGNGLRIFARYLWDRRSVGGTPFSVLTKGGRVRCEVRDNGQNVFVEMGTASFESTVIPVRGSDREVVNEAIEIEGVTLRFTGVTVGNPHCVVHMEEVSKETSLRFGPLLERHELFPHRTNVQFVQVLDPHRIRIEIWERGAGYTLASGSSSCAAAAASVRMGHCEGNITVAMPGGELEIAVGKGFALTMLGPVRKVANGELAPELLEDCGNSTERKAK